MGTDCLELFLILASGAVHIGMERAKGRHNDNYYTDNFVILVHKGRPRRLSEYINA